MIKNIFSVLFFLIILFQANCSINNSPAVYYIDSFNGNDSEDGRSINNAWKTLSRVNRHNFYPGDSILFIRNGKWKEELKITHSGNTENNIYFGNYGEGKLPEISGDFVRPYGIYIKGASYIVVDGFSVEETGIAGNNIRVRNSNNITIKNCSLLVNKRAGIYLADNSNCIVEKNFITTPAETLMFQADGIYAQFNEKNIYDGNTIIIKNQNPAEHSDCIQFFKETDAVVMNNYLEQQNDKKDNAQGMYCTTSYGVHYYFNNYIYAPNTHAQLLAFFNLEEGNGRVVVYNNTAIGGKMNTFRTDDPSAIVKNNIFVTSGIYSMVRFDKPLNSRSDVNGNLYLSLKEKPVYYLDGEITMEEWKDLGYENEGIFKVYDSEFINALDDSIKSIKGVEAKINLPDRNGIRFSSNKSIGARINSR